ncbi:hypothetical protein CRENBAI_009369 [Crenichthys baileyi]|uniref:Uncharacterized protein n=1 Tax=Crenichthys baileyi TaxID=28760 RepID=A0AAV9R0S6_9TELE
MPKKTLKAVRDFSNNPITLSDPVIHTQPTSPPQCPDPGEPDAWRATARLKDHEIETRKMTQFKEKLRAIQDDDKESLLEECSDYGRPEQTKDHRTDSEVPTYDLTAETENEEEGNESEQEQDQKHAEPSQGPTVTPYIVRQKGDIPQRIAQTKAEFRETIKKGILLSATLEGPTGAPKTYDLHTKPPGSRTPKQSK